MDIEKLGIAVDYAEVDKTAEAYGRLSEAINGVAEALAKLEKFEHGRLKFIHVGAISKCTLEPAP